MKLNKILKSFLIVFAGFLITLNFMAGSALADAPIKLDLAGQFKVYANNEQGVKVFYPATTFSDYGDYFFHAEGIWKGGPDIDECGPEGDPDYWNRGQMMDPQYDPFSLIINCDIPLEEYQYTRNPEIPLYQDQTCAFLMNDANYPDNTGYLTVEYVRMN